jgi:hypothetical protein
VDEHNCGALALVGNPRAVSVDLDEFGGHMAIVSSASNPDP